MTSHPPPEDPKPHDRTGDHTPPVPPALKLSEVLVPPHGDIGINPGSLPHDELRPRRRRVRLPLMLFLATCFTTFAAGAYQSRPTIIGSPYYVEVAAGQEYVNPDGKTVTAKEKGIAVAAWHSVLRINWRDGLTYMVCVMGVLLLHEMGHFVMTLRHRVPASFPFFIPLPITLMGTMGAVIGMEAFRANRKQLFDIGLAGPLAGLILTIPLVIVGLRMADSKVYAVNQQSIEYGDPLLVKLLIPLLHDVDALEREAKAEQARTGVEHRYAFIVNAVYMAGWVGMLLTGLNMLPISQLDGGHVSHALLGQHSKKLGRAFLIVAIGFIIVTESYNWILMLVLVIMIGSDHPPTADDNVDLGTFRRVLGFASLTIPILCFTPYPLTL